MEEHATSRKSNTTSCDRFGQDLDKVSPHRNGFRSCDTDTSLSPGLAHNTRPGKVKLIDSFLRYKHEDDEDEDEDDEDEVDMSLIVQVLVVIC